MKRLVITEYEGFNVPSDYNLDLTKTNIKDCTGCWSCWLKTPGRCIHKDLYAFYRAYLDADEVIILSRISQGFVSGNLKSLFDRMLPLYLPFITYKTGESMHVPRYAKYPEVEVYYQGEFMNRNDQKIYEDYIHRTFYQFHNKCEVVKPIAEFTMEKI